MNPSGKCSQERLTRGTVTSTMRRAAHPSGCARCGAGAGCSAIKYQSLTSVETGRALPLETRKAPILLVGLLDLYQSRGAVGHAVSDIGHAVSDIRH